MDTCHACDAKILFGGEKRGDIRFCGAKCSATYNGSTTIVPHAVIQREIKALREADCPVCKGSGPLDIYTAHNTVSVLVICVWNSKPRLSCIKCGHSHAQSGMIVSAVLGWWSLPGLIRTPMQLYAGFSQLSARRADGEPSPEMLHIVKTTLIKEMIRTGRPPVGSADPFASAAPSTGASSKAHPQQIDFDDSPEPEYVAPKPKQRP